ncbi:MAG TPA: hypothetical protein VFK35_03015 [Candidatus Limnocylindrales bacterium]|nr:hypothetical protein [Candidatus Limnocylindrales bacterium]
MIDTGTGTDNGRHDGRRIGGPGSRRRRALLGLAGTVAVTVLVVATIGGGPIRPGPSTPPGRSPDGAGTSEPSIPAPVVYYEVLDAAGSSLMERRLDGRSLARRVAQRTDVDYGRTWSVDPAGTLAVAIVPGIDEQELAAIDIATGQPRWSVRTPVAPLDAAVWSGDGRRFAIATLGSDARRREAIVVDAATGQFRGMEIPEDAILQGFESDGRLIVRRRLATAEAEAAWQFLRIDPATGDGRPVTAPPPVGPATDGIEDVHPAAGLAVDAVVAAGADGTTIRLWSLAGGPARSIATLSSIDRIAIDPAGTGVAIGAAQTIRFVRFDGGSSDIFSGPDPVADFGWSAGGDYLAVATDRGGSNLTVVEWATGRTVTLPQPDLVAQSLFVRIVGGPPLPADPLPADEPRPSATPAPSGPDVAGFDGVFSGWVEDDGARRRARVVRLTPTEGGGVRVAAAMPPIDLGPVDVPDEGGPPMVILPRPASNDVLVWLATPDGSRGWLWDGRDGLTPLALPPDWPADAYDLAWRPDGGALAASAGRPSDDGGFEGIFVVAAPGDRATTVIPIVGAYDRLEGWWSDAELQVGHGICAEGCEGRYAESARLRIRDGRQVELTVADRARGAIDNVTWNGTSIELSLINDDGSDDIVIAWPAALGSGDEVDVLGFGADGRTLLVAHQTADGVEVHAVADPVGRAVDGRVPDPAPSLLGRVSGRGLRIEVSSDAAWALAADRIDNVRLVRLADGRAWPLDRDRLLAWVSR